jgi:hypothetical protein
MENPFEITVPEKEEYNIDDYINMQNQLDNKNIDELLKSMFPPKNYFYDFYDFKNRCTRGIRQKLFDISNNILPIKNLYKIGDGGDGKSCIVCCTAIRHDRDVDSQNETRYNSSKTIKESLEQSGFNGYFYLFNGGFPNPTGIEMKYAGVPYCFKIFMMLEAKKKGFNKIIWVDSGCYSLNNPQPLFDILETDDTIIDYVGSNNNYDAMCFEKTIELLNSITNSDLHTAKYIGTIVFGLNLDSPKIQKIIEEYYDMVKLGLPFLSIFPEEIVLSSIFNKPEYQHLLFERPERKMLQINERHVDSNTAKQIGFFFYHRIYR